MLMGLRAEELFTFVVYCVTNVDTKEDMLYRQIANVHAVLPGASATRGRRRDPYGSAGMADPFPAAFGGDHVPGPEATFTLPVGINGTFPTRYNLPTLATWNLGIEHQLASNWLLSLRYFGNHGYHLSSNAIDNRELNPFIPGQSRRIDPNFSNVSLYPTDLNSRYHSLQVNVEKRFSRGVSLLANYTWSRAASAT